jgi:hypothetical protein
VPLNAWSRRAAVGHSTLLGAGLIVLAAALPLAARALAGPRGAIVHVRWQPSVTTADRQALEARFRLADGEQLDAGTWRYDLVDTARRNIESLVAEPAAADTHNIDRSSGVVDRSAIRTTRRLRFRTGDAFVAGVDRAAAALASLTVLVALFVAFARTSYARAAGLHTRRTMELARASVLGPVVRFLQRGIPVVDARTAGLFRIVFGTATLAFFALHPVDASWLTATFDLEIEGPVHQAVIEWLRLRPALVDGIGPWLMITGVAFTAGVFTHVTYPLFVAGALLWAYVAVSLSSTHPQSILILTLVALLPSRWGDALSVDAWRGRSTILPAGKRYGYSVWVPVLAFGVSFAAAAWAKLTVPPGWTSWVANGTVKYYFITDSVNAPVQWGLQLAGHPWLAVVASFLAIATECLVVTAAFVRNDRYRVIMGVAALCLVAGFVLFMGVVWPGWWVPLLAFLPWQRIAQVRSVRLQADEPGPAEAGHYGLSRNAITIAQLVMIVAIIAQQVVVSALRLERAPMFSWYDMYSGTYASPAAFNAGRPPRFRIVASTDRGTAALDRCNPHEEFVRQFQAAVEGSPDARDHVWAALSGCGDLAGVRAVALEGDTYTFDWDARQFMWERSARIIGPLVHPR